MSYRNLIVCQPRGIAARRADRAFDDIRRAFFAAPFSSPFSASFSASFSSPTPMVSRLGLRFPEGSWNPRIEAVEGEDAYRVRAEIPGVDESDLSVVVEEGVLTISGALRSEAKASTDEPSSESTAEADAGDETAEDTTYASFKRRIRLPGEIDEDEVKAVYKNGVLIVTVPKRIEEKPEPRSIPVEVV